jgi:hypothetical protein
LISAGAELPDYQKKEKEGPFQEEEEED